jgi:hypothetical protein
MRPLIRMYPRSAMLISVALIGICLSVGLLLAQSISTFRITSIQPTNNNVRITWDAPGGSNYVVQTSSNSVGSNFVDLSPAMFVAGPSVVPTNYTHFGAMLSSTSRFYRVRSSFNPFTVQVQPTNAVIGVTMTTRYKVFLIYSNSAPQDVTATATLTTLGGVAQTAGISPDGYALVLGTSTGVGSVRASYQGVTNAVTLTVAQLTGLYTVPPLSSANTVNGYVNGSGTSIQVMGIFSNGKTNNVTPSSTLDGGAASPTRMDYYITPDVANSYALITGQSAAAGDLDFIAGGAITPTFFVNWCWFTSVSLQSPGPTLSVGQVVPFSLIGHTVSGSNVNAFIYVPSYQDTFSSDSDSIALADGSTFNVTAVSPGTTTIRVNAYNGPGNYCAAGLDAFTSVTVTAPPATTRLWTNTYNGTGNSIDQGSAIVLDSGGNPSVTGVSYSGANYDIATVRYSSAGLPLWTNRYNGPGNGNDTPCGIAVDLSSNVFVSGTTIVGSGNQDWATMKYSASGVPLWTNRFASSGNNYDSPAGLAVDAAGNVFVTGDTTRGTRDFATIKYSGAGVPLWTNYYNGPANGYDSAAALSLDSGGNVYVTGVSTGTGGNYDYATVKYSNAGTPLWTNRFDGFYHTNDFVTAMAVDLSSNVFVTGYDSTHNASTLVKYSTAGTPLWTNSYNTSSAVSTMPRSLATDASGNVIVTGYGKSSSSENEWLTVKFSAAGTPVWTNRYNGTLNFDDTANAVAVDTAGNVIVTGSSFTNAVTIKYLSNGAFYWLAGYNGASGSDAAIDDKGNVFVTGYGPDNNNQYDYFTMKYAP